jgi:hypothetical protein
MDLWRSQRHGLVGASNASQGFCGLKLILFSGRSYSVSGFEFDLLPLSASVADPDLVQGEGTGEKSIGLVNGERDVLLISSFANLFFQELH